MPDGMPDTASMDDETFQEYRLKQTVFHLDPTLDKQAIPRLQHLRTDLKKWVVPVDKEMNLARLSQKHESLKRDWEASDHHRTLVEIFENTVLKQEDLSITACMCFGLGSMNTGGRERDQDSCDRSMLQLVCFESWVDLLKRKHMIENNIYFQEPEFNTLDEEFLKSKGYKVLHHPEADDYMNENLMIYSLGTSELILWSLFSVAIPAVYISFKILNAHLYHYFPPEPSHLLSMKNADIGKKDVANISYFRNRKERLPAFERASYHKLLVSFFEKRVGSKLKVKEPAWLASNWIYYKPDSKDGIRPYNSYIKPAYYPLEAMTLNPYNMETDDTKLYDRIEALTIWLERKVISQDLFESEKEKHLQRQLY